MLRIRFHGRGGQGMKTASRIVGTAAFRQGFFAQDSPVYGAERRGAPMTAFTRFDAKPVLERGFVSTPDFVVVADETLIEDQLVRPLLGMPATGVALINSTRSAEEWHARQPISGFVISFDFTTLALALAGSTAGLSVALGAATAKISGLELLSLEEAVREELEALALAPESLERNLTLARAAFEATAWPVAPVPDETSASPAGRPVPGIVTPEYRGGWAGTASVAATSNTPARRTGDWRVSRPVIDSERCTHCWICFVSCPDGAIALSTDDLPEIDYGVCKGCLLCVEECPIDAVHTVREAEAR